MNSEGAVFFLFFEPTAAGGGAGGGSGAGAGAGVESVCVLKFAGTDARTRSELFANTVAAAVGVRTP